MNACDYVAWGIPQCRYCGSETAREGLYKSSENQTSHAEAERNWTWVDISRKRKKRMKKDLARGTSPVRKGQSRP